MTTAEKIAQRAQQVEHETPRADDDAFSVADSTGDSSFGDTLASLRSSIMDYRVENGRTYHRLSDGKYVVPNDEQEQDRLDVTHHLWTLTWDGNICNSPKKDGARRVLDIGTGTGIWALDYADEHPEATVLGVDLSPIQPKFVPPNCSFEIDDVEKEWTWSEPFDFIFIRAMLASFSSWKDVLAQAYDNLEPGGYIEIHDNAFPLRCNDDTMTEDSKSFKWSKMLIEATNQMGRPISLAPSFQRLVKDAGFVDVVERKAIWPITPWPEDEKLKERGMWTQAASMSGIEAVSLALFTRVLGWTAEETRVLIAEVREEHKRTDVHAYYDIYCVWGRKPEKEASEPPEA